MSDWLHFFFIFNNQVSKSSLLFTILLQTPLTKNYLFIYWEIFITCLPACLPIYLPTFLLLTFKFLIFPSFLPSFLPSLNPSLLNFLTNNFLSRFCPVFKFPPLLFSIFSLSGGRKKDYRFMYSSIHPSILFFLYQSI